jgi:hypothetical protein
VSLLCEGFRCRTLAEITTVAGQTLSPRAMRGGVYVVDEIAVGATA